MAGETIMARKSIGEQPPRYLFLLNPYSDIRLSKCPKCEKLTHPRKFALLIDIKGWGPLALGKTCRYCSPCELIIVHQDELEAELAHSLAALAPESIGKDYLVLGTLDKKTWRKGVEEGGQTLGEALKQVAEFKEVLQLHVEPGGWRPA
jgi:hypothetical protein